jgi:hypothetical protein
VTTQQQGWIGVDLDGTLAEYQGWLGPELIGLPVAKMVERVKAWLHSGKEVRIFTARVANDDINAMRSRVAIDRWCETHIGRRLPITCRKDFAMVELWDDRAVQVTINTGERVDGLA